MFDWAVVIPLLLPLLISLVATAVCYRRRRYGDNNPRVTRWLTVGVAVFLALVSVLFLWTPRSLQAIAADSPSEQRWLSRVFEILTFPIISLLIGWSIVYLGLSWRLPGK